MEMTTTQYEELEAKLLAFLEEESQKMGIDLSYFNYMVIFFRLMVTLNHETGESFSTLEEWFKSTLQEVKDANG
jgi:hypothetical protein